MSWLPVRFPPRIAMGVACQPGWQVQVTGVLSGNEKRNLDWQDARHSYDAGLAVRTESDYAEVIDHFHMARGRFHHFGLRDPVDYQCTQARGVVMQWGTTGGLPVLHKRYGNDNQFAYFRRISRPIIEKFTLFQAGNDAPLQMDVDYTLNPDTGEIDSSLDPNTLQWSGQFLVPVRYDLDSLPTRVVNRNGRFGQLLLQASSIPLVEVRDRPLVIPQGGN